MPLTIYLSLPLETSRHLLGCPLVKIYSFVPIPSLIMYDYLYIYLICFALLSCLGLYFLLGAFHFD